MSLPRGQVLPFDVSRFCPDFPLPALRFVPGQGQLHPRKAGTLIEIADDVALVVGLDLFFAGYFWEAHEAWEGLWMARGRAGPPADAVRGLIKIAAAGVKVLQEQPRGVHSHLAGALDYLSPLNSDAAQIVPVSLSATLNALRPVVSCSDMDKVGEADIRSLIVVVGAQSCPAVCGTRRWPDA